MALGILIMLVALEMGFLFYSIRERSYKRVQQSVMRTGMFLAFALLFMVSGLKWHARWYAFSAWLLLLALLGLRSLLVRNPETARFKTGVAIRRTVVGLLLYLIALAPALLFPQYDPLPVSGSFAVATRTYSYVDAQREEMYSNSERRELTVQYWFPEGTTGKFPVVVFSHGAFGVRTSNLSLYREMASHGYVVASIDHTYQCLFTTTNSGKIALMNRDYVQEVSREDAKTDKHQSFAYYQKWMDVRTADIDFVIDHLVNQAGRHDAGAVYTLVDSAKIGVMGHSLGGSAALGIGRVRSDVSAVMALEAPYLSDIVGVENDDFVWNAEKYPLPVLNVYSDSSWPHLGVWPQYRRNAEMLDSTNEDVHNVYLQGAGHLTLTDLSLTSPALTRILNGHSASISVEYCLGTINEIALQFFNYYLKGHETLSIEEIY